MFSLSPLLQAQHPFPHVVKFVTADAPVAVNVIPVEDFICVLKIFLGVESFDILAAKLERLCCISCFEEHLDLAAIS